MMTTDTERMDFLETLRNRTIFVNKKNPAYYKRTDIHISGPAHCAIYARTEIGSSVEFEGHGESVREAIDAAMQDSTLLYGICSLTKGDNYEHS
jgi:hypothetical protein